MTSTKAAGIHFIKKNEILLGRKAYGKLKDKWSGLGGSVERGESAKSAAIREVLEELYGLEHISPKLVRELSDNLILTEAYRTESYTLFTADLAELRKFNQGINRTFRTIPFFGPRIPITIQGMISKFDPSVSRKPEITKIKLFSFSEILAAPDMFDPYLVADITAMEQKIA